MTADEKEAVEQQEYLAGLTGWALEIHRRVEFGQKPLWERMLLKPPKGWKEGGLLMEIWDQLAWWRWQRRGD